MVEYNVIEEDDNVEEDDGVEEQLVDDHVLDHKDVEEVQGDVRNKFLDEDDIDDVLSNEEFEEDEPNVGDDVRHDDMIIGNDDIDDDAEITDRFNTIFEADDINVDLNLMFKQK